MKKIIVLLLSIIISSYVLDKIAYFVISKLEEKVLTGQNVGKFNHYLKLKDSIDLAIFGSSRANHHINPEIFSDNAFNMGMDGRGMAFYWTAVKMLPPEKKQEIIINIDPLDILSPEYSGEDIAALAYLYHKNDRIKEELVRRNNFNPLANFYWCIGYNSKFLGIIINNIKPRYDYKKYNGYDPLQLSESQKSIRNKKFAQIEEIDCSNYEKQIKSNDIALSYLKLIADYCTNENKTLFMVTTPVRSDKCKDDNRKLEELMASLSINYWDFTDHFKDDPDIDLWKDNTHLSGLGANKFSTFLAVEIENIRASNR